MINKRICEFKGEKATTTMVCDLADAYIVRKLHFVVEFISEHLMAKDTFESKQILLCQSTFLTTTNARATLT